MLRLTASCVALLFLDHCAAASFNCVPKHLLKYPYIGNADVTYDGHQCEKVGERACTTDSQDGPYGSPSVESRFNVTFRNIYIGPRCKQQHKDVECFVACEDTMEELCIPYIFWNFPGWYRGTVKDKLSPTECLIEKTLNTKCPSNRCGTFKTGTGGVRCTQQDEIPCVITCEHYYLTCNPTHLFRLEPHFFNEYYSADSSGKGVPIFNNATMKCEVVKSTSSARLTPIQMFKGKANTFLDNSEISDLPLCTNDTYKRMTSLFMEQPDCISEEVDLYYYRLHLRLKKTIYFPRDRAYSGAKCISVSGKKAVCMRDSSRPTAYCYVAKNKTEPCYTICQHDLIECVPLFGPAFSEAQDTSMLMGNNWNYTSHRYGSSKTKTVFNDKCKQYEIPAWLKTDIKPHLQPSKTCAAGLNYVNDSGVVKIQYLSTPVCSQGQLIQPCFETCRLTSDSFVEPFRHLLKKEVEMLENYIDRVINQGSSMTTLRISAPLIMFVSKKGPNRVYCDRQGRVESITKQNSLPYTCLDVELNHTAYSVKREDITKPLLHTVSIVDSNDNSESTYASTAFNFVDLNDMIVCRDEGDLMGEYFGTVAITVEGKVCEFWSRINRSEFDITKHVPAERVADQQNYCRNWGYTQMGPWCFIKGQQRLQRKPCFNVCTKTELKWKKNNCLLGMKMQPDYHSKKTVGSTTTRTGRKCACPNREHMELSGHSCSCEQRESFTYIGPTCHINATAMEHCFFACEHLKLKCIDRNKIQNIEYNGPKQTTVSNRPCEQWSRVFEEAQKNHMNYQWSWIFNETRLREYNNGNKESYSSTLSALISGQFEKGVTLEHNYCLNVLTFLNEIMDYAQYPGLDPVILKGPICFVNDNDFLIPQPCFKTCEDEWLETNDCIIESEVSNTTYTGYRNRSVSGKPCLRWDTKLRSSKIMPPEYTGPLHNYCRNYGRFADGPWCYVMQGKKVTKEECFRKCDSEKKAPMIMVNDNWRRDMCGEGFDCESLTKEEETPPPRAEGTLQQKLDAAWEDPLENIKAAVNATNYKWLTGVICFGIYTLLQLLLCLFWSFSIWRQPDVQAKREKLDLDYELRQLKKQQLLLAEKHKNRKKKAQRAKPMQTSSSRLSGFRKSMAPSRKPEDV